jgi:protein required for attachment to host cells
MSWILIANRTGARLVEKQGSEFALLESFNHEQGRKRDREIDSDRHGRSFDRMGANRHAYSNEESAHEHDARGFARELAERLGAQRTQHRFERLVLVAEPRFLGYLREALDDATKKTVIASVPKDLAEVALRELPGHLPELPSALA